MFSTQTCAPISSATVCNSCSDSARLGGRTAVAEGEGLVAVDQHVFRLQGCDGADRPREEGHRGGTVGARGAEIAVAHGGRRSVGQVDAPHLAAVGGKLLFGEGDVPRPDRLVGREAGADPRHAVTRRDGVGRLVGHREHGARTQTQARDIFTRGGAFVVGSTVTQSPAWA